MAETVEDGPDFRKTRSGPNKGPGQRTQVSEKESSQRHS